MSSKLVSSIALAACLLASGGAFAEVLYQQAPTADATGESANNPVVTGEPLLFQSIPSLGNVTLEKIVWWGLLPRKLSNLSKKCHLSNDWQGLRQKTCQS